MNEGGIEFTFGASQAARNLMASILQQPEYRQYKEAVCRRLSKQLERLNAVMDIRNSVVRQATLKMWHDTFPNWCRGLPEIVKTHAICVETGWYRYLLKGRRHKDLVLQFAHEHGISRSVAATTLVENNDGLMDSLDRASRSN